MVKQETPRRSLGDIRVLDLAGPLGIYCTKMLADLGADVIKVERPGGDPTRNLGPFYHDDPHPERSLYFFHFNTNKKSITLDIETTDGKDLLKRLVKGADILVETFPPSHLEGMGLGYPALREVNPGLILTSITPFGQSGPYRDFKGSDIIGLAMGGLMFMGGFPEDPPRRMGASQAYHEASVNASVATLAALYYKDVTGEGQQVDVSMQECIAVALQFAMTYYDLRKEIVCRRGTENAIPMSFPPKRNPRGLYPCKDGYVNLNPIGRLREVMDWMDSKGMAADLMQERWVKVIEQVSYADSLIKLFADPVARERYMKEELPYIDGLVANFLAQYPMRQLCEEGQKWRIPITPINTAKDLAEDPQLNSGDFFVDVEHPELGDRLTYPGRPYRLSETPWSIARRAPLIGEHNEEVYEGELRLSKERIRSLKEAGVI